MAVFTVTTGLDVIDAGDGLTSLREAVALANGTPGTDTVDLSGDHFGPDGIIRLTSGNPITITDSTVIEGHPTDPRIITGDVDGNDDFVTGATGVTDGVGTNPSQLSDNVRVFQIAPGTPMVTFRDLTITGGRSYQGGGVRVLDDSGNTDVFFENVDLVGNLSTSGGGGAVFSQGDVTITGKAEFGVFRNLSYGANADGGAIHGKGHVQLNAGSLVGTNYTYGTGGRGGGIYAGSVTAITSEISNNATFGAGGHGGGIFATGEVALYASTLQDNTIFTGGNGGGASGNSIKFYAGTLADNTANDGYGGGLNADYGVAVSNSVIVRNTTSGDNAPGGAIFGSAITVSDSVFLNNTTNGTSSDGGAISAATTLMLTNATFARNETTGGNSGGGAVSATDATIKDSSFSGNGALAGDSEGGAVWAKTTLMLDGALILGNAAGTATPGKHEIGGAATISGSNNNIVGDSEAAFAIGANGGFIEHADPADVFSSTGTVNGRIAGFHGNNGGAIASIGLRGAADNPALDRNPNAAPDADDSRGFPRSVDQPGIGNEVTDVTDIGSLELDGFNQPPVAQDDFVQTGQNTPILVNARANDSDPDGDTIVVISTTQPANGTVMLTGGDVEYTPNQGFSGQDSFEYTIRDTQLNQATATVTVTVAANSPPVAVDDTATSTGNEILKGVLANDSDPDGDTLILLLVDDPANGTASISGNGIIYEPDEGFEGADAFDYTISDGNGGTDTATLTVTVTLNNLPNFDPVAENDFVTIAAGAMVSIDALFNDSDPNGDPISLTSVDDPANGSAQIVGGAIDYTPNQGFLGTDQFDYTISDGKGGTDTATISVEVVDPGADNLPPVAADDMATTVAETPVVIDVLANDSDPNGDPLTVSFVTNSDDGFVEIFENKVRYTPDPGFTGGDSFLYSAIDGRGGIDIGEVFLTVGVFSEFPPNAVGDGAATEQFVPVSIDVLANDSDPDGNPLTVTDVTVPSGGRAFIQPDGTVDYAPRPDFTGADSFIYTISDGAGGTDTAAVSLTVSPIDEDVVCARIIAYLYEAAFNRFPDLPGVNFWIDQALEVGLSKEEIASFFLTVPEFESLYGPVDALSDQDLVEQLFENTLDRPGDPLGVAFWVDVLASPSFGRADLLLAFAQSPENQLGSPDIVTLQETSPSEWEFVA